MSRYIKNDITIAIIYENGGVGCQWKNFMEEMFTVDLPEQCRDLGLDIKTVSVDSLDDDDISNIDCCAWKLFLFSYDMMKCLADNESRLSQSNLLNTRSDRNIILILGDENDLEFVGEVKRSLCIYPEFTLFHLVRATNPGKIFTDIMEVVSPICVVFHPNILSCEDLDQHITLIANKPYPSSTNIKFMVEFKGGSNVEEHQASLFNPCTLLLKNPGCSPGMMDVTLYTVDNDNDTKKTKIGENMNVWFQSDLDKIHSALERNSNPFAFLCQALNINVNNNKEASDAVDKVLTESFRKNIPVSKLSQVFGNDQPVNHEGNRREQYPTLLHFASAYGLHGLTALLLRCPGSVQAFGTCNCDGDYPTNLAEKAGYWDLKDYMISYMEVSAMVDYEMGDRGRTSEMMSQMVTGQYLSLPRVETKEESPYERTLNPPPGYVPMKSLFQPTVPVDYDQPFIIPIPIIEDSPTYDSMLKQMLESHECEEDIYMSIMTQPPLSEAPIVPPRDTRRSMEEEERVGAGGAGALVGGVGGVGAGAGGAERVTYGTLSIPKIHSLLSPAQQELIQLQQKVKNNELTTNQAVLRFKEWERKHKEQAASFQFQQECLQRVRLSLIKSREEKRSKGVSDVVEISGPIVAGSSTYDLVLRKTNDGDPSEVIYGSTTVKKETKEKPPEPAPRVIRPTANFGSSHIESFNSMVSAYLMLAVEL
nr:phosphoinositide 3-kinase adapter protein 1 [Ciona intestinalis]|eukprot:XP_026694968.1 phosphoinositide 3-kinase adapter protein 1 [Ciona intestinalis]